MYDRIAGQVFNTPLLVEAARLDVIAAVVASRMGMEGVKAPEFDGKAPEMTVPDDAVFNEPGGYYVTPDGIGIVGMMGTMIHRGGFMSALSGLTSYTGIKKQFKHAISNGAVKGVLLDANTPGGSAAGAFDTADFFFQSRGIKPVYAIAEDQMTSAGYLLGSAADRVYTTQTGRVGSIGVVMQLLNFSKMNEKRGLESTYIYAGDRKIDGAPDAPLTKEAHARFQADITRLYDMFVIAADRNRATLTGQVIRDTQAGVYMGQEAVDIGLADEVANIEQVLDQLRSDIRGAGSRQFSTTVGMEDKSMSNTQASQTNQTTDAPTGQTSSEPVAAAEPVTPAVPAAADEQASERARIKTIMTSEHAKGNQSLAEHLAYNTQTSAEDCIATLKASAPVAATQAAPNRLDAAMSATPQPNVGGGVDGGSEVSAVDRICSSYQKAAGIK